VESQVAVSEVAVKPLEVVLERCVKPLI